MRLGPNDEARNLKEYLGSKGRSGRRRRWAPDRGEIAQVRSVSPLVGRPVFVSGPSLSSAPETGHFFRSSKAGDRGWKGTAWVWGFGFLVKKRRGGGSFAVAAEPRPGLHLALAAIARLLLARPHPTSPLSGGDLGESAGGSLAG